MGTSGNSSPQEHLSDEELWSVMKKGDKKGLELLFRRHYDSLFRYAAKFSGNREKAEDLIQDLFIKIWIRRKNLGNVSGVKTYLWTALRRDILDDRKKTSAEIRSIAGAFKEVKMEFSAEELVIKKEDDSRKSEKLKNALNKLHYRQQEILYLKYFEGMSYDEIEKITTLNYQSIRNYVYEGIKMLKTILNHPAVGVVMAVTSLLASFFIAFLLL